MDSFAPITALGDDDDSYGLYCDFESGGEFGYSYNHTISLFRQFLQRKRDIIVSFDSDHYVFNQQTV